MLKLSLPFWLDGTELAKLRAAAQSWWGKVENWLRWPLLQLDPQTCHLTVLDMLAWQRDISRFVGEPESLYRLRVKHAFSNAVDAGSGAGMLRIFQRLGVGYVEIEERIAGADWDVVALHLSGAQLSQNGELLRVLVRQYGRTCRRYELTSIEPLTLSIVAAEFSDDQQTLVAVLQGIASEHGGFLTEDGVELVTEQGDLLILEAPVTTRFMTEAGAELVTEQGELLILDESVTATTPRFLTEAGAELVTEGGELLTLES